MPRTKTSVLPPADDTAAGDSLNTPGMRDQLPQFVPPSIDETWYIAMSRPRAKASSRPPPEAAMAGEDVMLAGIRFQPVVTATPLPDSEAVCRELPGELISIVSTPFRGPVAEGLKVTTTVHELTAASWTPVEQVDALVFAKSPLTVMLEIVSDWLLPLVRVNDLVGLPPGATVSVTLALCVSAPLVPVIVRG